MKKISCLSHFSFVLIAMLAIGFFSSCKKTGAPAGDTIPVGEFASLTGGTATFGQSVHNGDVLAVDEINASGGVLGKQLDLMTEDDQSKTEDAVASVQKLVNSDHVVAVLGEVASSRSMAGAPICQQAHVPMITPASTNEDVTKKGDYIFRICFTDPFQGQTMARFAMSSLGKKRAAILTDVKQDYSVGLDDAFKNTFTFAGGEIVSEQSYSSGDKDFHAPLTSIKGSNPDVIFVPGYYTEVSLIVRQARELGIDCPILGGDGWDSPELTKGNEQQFNNTYFSDHFSTEDPDTTVQAFIKKYQDRYHAVPDAMAALGYDAARILADAIKRAGSTDSAKVKTAIANTKNFPGVTGAITIDEFRNAQKPITIIKIVNGAFHFAQRIGPNGEPQTPFKP
ncbi:MAG TPA: ABC transporter substrate-binding protein [Candidatus Kapabacteria bacterium]|jgi:branched-chain amino acid transport system substrate-binding protein